MLRNRLLGSVAMATGLLMAIPIHAQQNDGVTLRPIIVTPARPAATPTPQADGLETPLSATTLQSTDIKPEAAASSDTASVLGNIPGVNIYSAGGVSGLPVVDGLADDRLNILIDGASISSACANHMNPPLSYIAPLNIGKVEVLSGVTPVSKGGDSIGGTIIVDRQAPQFAATRGTVLTTGEVSAFYRSVNNGFATAGNATVATDKFSVNYQGDFSRGENYRAGNGEKIRSTLYETQNHAATLAYRHDGQLLALTTAIQHIPYQGYANQRMDMVGNDAVSLNLKYKGEFAWGTMDSRIYWQQTRHEMEFLADKQPAQMPMDTKGTDLGYSVKFDIPLTRADTVRLGNELHSQLLDDWWPAIAGSTMMGPNDYWNIRDGRRDRIGTFGEWERKWSSSWTTLVGVRNDTVWSNTGDVQPYNPVPSMMNPNANAATAFNAKDHARRDVNFDATALVRYTPSLGSSYELGYSRKTRSPNLYERYAWGTGGMSSSMTGWFGDGNGYVGNLDLKPEVANNISFTAAWSDPAGKKWELKVKPYYSYVADFIDVNRYGTFTDRNGGTFPILQFANHNARLYGVDASGRVKVLERVRWGEFALLGQFAYVNGKNLDTGDNLYHIMPVNGRIGLEQKLGDWTSLVETQMVGAKSNVQSLRLEQTTPAYTLVNWRASYTWKNLRFDLGVENIFDKNYALPLGGFDYTYYKATSTRRPVPGPGRNVYAGLTVKF